MKKIRNWIKNKLRKEIIDEWVGERFRTRGIRPKFIDVYVDENAERWVVKVSFKK